MVEINLSNEFMEDIEDGDLIAFSTNKRGIVIEQVIGASISLYNILVLENSLELYFEEPVPLENIYMITDDVIRKSNNYTIKIEDF